ncbi:hypothetical protein IPZ69_30980 [Streptomyces olivochromogenes]|nr:hypothetical protein [Streptomyces olivochromogenes]
MRPKPVIGPTTPRVRPRSRPNECWSSAHSAPCRRSARTANRPFGGAPPQELIAVDQDRLGRQATVLSSSGGRWVIVKQLADGSRAVALFNETGQPQTISTTARAVQLPTASTYTVRDLWQHTDTRTTGNITATVPAHGTVVYRVSPATTGN